MERKKTTHAMCYIWLQSKNFTADPSHLPTRTPGSEGYRLPLSSIMQHGRVRLQRRSFPVNPAMSPLTGGLQRYTSNGGGRLHTCSMCTNAKTFIQCRDSEAILTLIELLGVDVEIGFFWFRRYRVIYKA